MIGEEVFFLFYAFLLAEYPEIAKKIDEQEKEAK